MVVVFSAALFSNLMVLAFSVYDVHVRVPCSCVDRCLSCVTRRNHSPFCLPLATASNFKFNPLGISVVSVSSQISNPV